MLRAGGGLCGLTVNDEKRGITSLLDEFIPTYDLIESGIHFYHSDNGVAGMVIGQGQLGGWNLLGCPVGTDEFCRQTATELLRKKAQNLRRISGLENVQYETTALRYYGS